jgi:K+-sensing histidine kinase KdpD
VTVEELHSRLGQGKVYKPEKVEQALFRWEILMKGSTLNRFLEEVRDAAIQVVPLGDPER